MLKLLRNRVGTAEIVGTVLFLVILFFFFSNVFLWHNQVTQEMERTVADKMNSAVRVETVVRRGESVHVKKSGDEYIYKGFGDPSPVAYDPESTRYCDSNYRTIREQSPGDYVNQLMVDYTFYTGIHVRQRVGLVSALRLCVRAGYEDLAAERCFIRVYNFSGAQWSDTGLAVMGAFGWFNVTLSQPNNYVDSSGLVKIEFQDASSKEGYVDNAQGELDIDYMEVAAEQVVLEVSDLGGVDVSLSRLWILNNTQTAYPEKDHVFADLERNLWASGGSHRDIEFNMTVGDTEFEDGAVKVVIDDERIVVNYVPASGQTVVFKVVTKLGNTAACSLDFP